MHATQSKTIDNLEAAFTGEAGANRRYLAYAQQAMTDGYPEIAQLFMEAAGAETVHALNHLRVLGTIGTTAENLEESALGEGYEIEELYPRFIREAWDEGRLDAVSTFSLALEREKHHRQMFCEALAQFHATQDAKSESEVEAEQELEEEFAAALDP